MTCPLRHSIDADCSCGWTMPETEVRTVMRSEGDRLRAALCESLDAWERWVEQEYRGTGQYVRCISSTIAEFRRLVTP